MSEPSDGSPVARVLVVGMGPGDPAYLTTAAREVLGSIRRLAGWKSALELARPWTKAELHELSYKNQTDVIEKIREFAVGGDSCGLACWGDPSVSERQLLERLEHAGLTPEIVPGVSSVQVAAQRARISLDESVVISFHKAGDLESDKEFLWTAMDAGRGALLLPRPWDFMPADIAKHLIGCGVGHERQVIVCQRLTLPDEDSSTFAMSDLAKSRRKFSDLTVVAIPTAEAK